MTDENIKSVVKETVNELLGNSMIKYSELIIYEQIGERLREYYKEPGKDPDIAKALSQIKDHHYYNVLEMYYKDNRTLESIADKCYVDISTIVRNKKALCIKIFNLIN